jgi:hypothetical protein
MSERVFPKTVNQQKKLERLQPHTPLQQRIHSAYLEEVEEASDRAAKFHPTGTTRKQSV